MSLRNRLLAASLLLVGFGLVVANVATYGALRSFLHNRVDQQLRGAEQAVLGTLGARGGRLRQESLIALQANAPRVYVQIRAADGRPLLTLLDQRPGQPSSSPRLPASWTGSGQTTLPAAEPDGPRYRARTSTFPGGETMVVALPLDDTEATLRRLLATELLVSAAVLAAAAGLGLWLVRLGLRPLADIERTAAAVTSGGLAHRVARDDEQTEVGRLGRALNVMLDRIDTAFAERTASETAARRSEQRMRRFVADASHELRTPVAAVCAYAELYRLGAHRHPEDLARVLARIEHEGARMGLLVDDLLLLTRLDEGRPLERRAVDLGLVASDAVDAARAVDPDRSLALEVQGSVEVTGDRDRLRQVVDNLLANVRAHTPEETAAHVRVRADGPLAVLEVEDEGPGLPEGEAGRMFERFYRADPARSRDRGGAGLGLSIVAAIAVAHGGEASAGTGEKGGALFRVSLPLLDETTETTETSDRGELP